VLALISYRPWTLADVARGLGTHPNEGIKYVDHLIAEGAIRTEVRGEETYYVRGDFSE